MTDPFNNGAGEDGTNANVGISSDSAQSEIPPPTYRLTLRALPAATPPTIRLRHVLKRLLRTFEFRAVSVEEVRDDEGIPITEDAS